MNRRRWVLLICSLVLLLGMYGVDRAMVAFIGVGPLSFLRPPLPVVRDGWIAGGERHTALAEVKAFSEQLALPGGNQVATVVSTECSEGQNSYKSRDGYRLSCAAAARSFQGWSGDFLALRSQASAALGSKCSGPVPTPVNWIPKRGSTDQVAYQCGAGIEVRLAFGASDGISPDDPALVTGQDGEQTRHVSGPTAAELVEELAGHEWFVVQDVRKVYFEDRP